MNKKIIVTLVLGVVLITSSVFLIARGNFSSKNFTNNAPVKEFKMTSFTEMVNGKSKPHFSLNEIVVNKGDKVRIKITEISGMHDFAIDEFGVYTKTPLNQESVVEFIANKSGNFVYYCTKPGHRQNGQWGTLKVI